MIFRMPFGKYKGRLITEVDDGYLDWLYSLDNLYPQTAENVAAEWKRRHDRQHDWVGARGTLPPAAQAAAAQVVQEGYRALTRKWHPDVGGDLTQMQALNAAVDWLRAKVQEGK